MWGSARRVLHELMSCSPAAAAVRSFSLTPAQSTVIVERWWQVPLSKEGRPPRLYPRRHRVYRFVEDSKTAPKEKMELILTQTVPKLGGRGDTVFVKKSMGRNKLLPEGLAVYPSPENKQMFAEELRLLREGRPEDRIQTRTGELTVKYLKRINLLIHKMPDEGFQLTKEVVCRQLQKKFLVVVPPQALNLPLEPIKEEGEYWCEVTVNGIDTVRIPLSLLPYEDQSRRYKQLKKKLLLQQQQEDGEEEEQQQQEAVQGELQEQQQEAVQGELQEQQQESELTPEVKGEHQALVASEAAAVKADAPKDSVASEASASPEVPAAEETNSVTQTSPDPTAPPSECPKKE